MDQNTITKSWIRLLFFFITLAIVFFLLFIPLVFAFPEELNNKPRSEHDPVFVLANEVVYVCGALGTYFLFRVKIEKRSAALDFSLTAFLRYALLGTATLGTVIALLTTFNAITLSPGINNRILFHVALYMMVAASEEIICRGYLLNNLLETMKPIYAVVLSSVLFGLLHFFNDGFSLLAFANISLSGVLLCISYIRSKNVWAPVGMHFAWNFFQGPIMGFGVSGFHDESYFKINYLSTNQTITGGPFGLEGSLLTTATLLLAVIFFSAKMYLK